MEEEKRKKKERKKEEEEEKKEGSSRKTASSSLQQIHPLPPAVKIRAGDHYIFNREQDTTVRTTSVNQSELYPCY